MKNKIENQFIVNYVLMFIISTIIALGAFALTDFANHILSKTLVKNNFTAADLMADDYGVINTTGVVENGGGVQIIDENRQIVFSEGLDTFGKKTLTVSEFTDFLIRSKSVGITYSYDIAYNEREKFWLVVTFPTSIRIDFAIARNQEHDSVDYNAVAGMILAVMLFYLILLAVSTIIYSKLTSVAVVAPLKKLRDSARRLRDGDYSTRVELDSKNEFGELQETFNAMADQIEQEISLRKQSEENRKRLILDVSHDLKNPLSSIMGYSEMLQSKPDLPSEERRKYAGIIYENSQRANRLITDLFELSRLESSDYEITKKRVDIGEYLREEIGKFIPVFENAGFTYQVVIPEKEIDIMLDTAQMDRVIQNLSDNAVRYNPAGTEITVRLTEEDDAVTILFKDNGIGMPEALSEEIFLPFVRADDARNSKTGGTGLGLAIARKIVEAHGGSISLAAAENLGCTFKLRIPKI